MSKKRKAQNSKPWCWYCDREFDDEKILINHQKAKHFKCHYCHKKLNTGSGLVIHIAQLHKETVFRVPNAIEGRDTPEVEIYGMAGVPVEDLQKHREGLPVGPYKRNRLTEPGAGMLPLLAAQKAAIPELEVQPQDIPKAPLPTSLTSSSSAPISPTDDGAVQKPSETVLSAPATTYASAPATTTFTSPQMPPINPMAPPPPASYYPPQPYGYPYPYPQQPYYPYPQHYGYPQQPFYGYPGYPPQHYGYPPPMQPYPPAVSPVPAAATSTGEEASPLISPASAGEVTALKILPRMDEASGKMIPGSIIVAPDLELSIEEKRSQLPKYQLKSGDSA